MFLLPRNIWKMEKEKKEKDLFMENGRESAQS